MNFRSFLFGFVCCIGLGVLAFKQKTLIRQSLFYRWWAGISYRVEKQKFPVLEHAMYPFSLPELPYGYEDLEPHIDARTLEIHHTKHQQSAIDSLNKALKDFPEYHQKTLAHLLEHLNTLPDKLRTPVRDFGGSHFNHTFYFSGMSPDGGTLQEGPFSNLLIKTFGSFNAFKATFETKAKTLIGSGWIWLCLDKNNKLLICSSPNYDVPFEHDYFPLLVLDVWEHAYYLKYQNQRLNYIQAWWNVVNWEQVKALYAHALGNNKK